MTRSLLLASVAALALAAPVEANNIGSVAALNRQVEGTPPDATKRTLSIGEGVVQEELIESSPIGSGQLLFLDQTTLTIAKNSKIVLDRYVYDPGTQTGEFSMRMTQGVLRFIGGRISKDTDAVITTPTATIGIRGGMAIITVDPDGTTRAQHIAGEYTRITTNDGESLVISRNNGLAEVPAFGVFGTSSGDGENGEAGGGEEGGGQIRYLGVADREYVARITRELIGRGEAGARRRPENPDVIASGIIVRNSGEKDAVQTFPISTTGESQDNTVTEETVFIVRNEEAVQTDLNLDALPDPEVPPPPPTREPLAGVTGSAALAETGVDGLTTDDSAPLVFTQVFEGSRIGVTAAGEEFEVPSDVEGRFSFGFSEGRSPNGALRGQGFYDPGREFLYAVTETRDNETGYFLIGRPSGPLADAPAGAVRTRGYDIAADLVTDGAAFLPSSLSAFSSAGTTELLLISNEGGAGAGGNAKALAGYLEIAGAGPGQTSGLGVIATDVFAANSGTPAIGGFFQGVFTNGSGGSSLVTSAVATVEDGQGASAFGSSGQYLALSNRGDFGQGVETLVSSAVDEAGNSTLFGSATYASRTGVVDRTALQRNNLGSGVLNGYAAISSPSGFSARNLSPEDVTLILNTNTNSVSASFLLDAVLSDEEGAPTLVAAFGGETGGSALVDAQTFGANGAATGGAVGDSAAVTSGALVSAGFVGDGGVFPSGVDTTPQHLTWGWWAASLDPSSPAEANPENLHLGAWIAGDLTASAAIPTDGLATYEGFAAVSGVENGQTFVDGAGFELTYEYGSGGVGTAQFTDLLGDNPTVAVRGIGSGGNYSGVAGITANGREGLIAVDGRFFNAGGVAAGATGGAIDILTNDRALRGSGVFAGDRTTFVPGAGGRADN